MKFIVSFLFICLTLQTCSGGIATTAKDVMKVIGFATDVYSFFDKLFSNDDDNAPAPIDYDRIIGEISEHIQLSTTAILHKTEIEAHLRDVRRSARAISQLLEQMKQIIEAEKGEKRKALEKQFIDDFELEKNQLNSLKSLLVLTVPDISSTLLALIAKEVNCGMTGLENFQNYYMDLIRKSVAIELVYESLKGDLLHEAKLKSWTTAVTQLLEEFEQEKDLCKADFLRLAQTDFDRIDDAESLFYNNQDRFPYMLNDVLLLGGSYCVRYLKNYDKIFSKSVSGDNMIIAVFGKEENVAAFSKEQFDKVATTSFANCAKELDTEIMIALFNVLSYDVVFWLEYPMVQKEKNHFFLDKNTTGIKVVMTENNLEYQTIVYVRRQTENSTTLHAEDYKVQFREKYTASASALFDRNWIFGLLLITDMFFRLAGFGDFC